MHRIRTALDLASLASVRTFAAEWTGDLDILINNAGIMQVTHGLTEDASSRRWASTTSARSP